MKTFEEVIDYLKQHDIALSVIGSTTDVIDLAGIDPAKSILIIDADDDNDTMLLELNKMGYYNIIQVENRFNLTEEELNGVKDLADLMIDTSFELVYKFNRTNAIQRKLMENKELKKASVILSELLYSININDSNKFKNVVKYSLDSLMQSTAALQQALTTVDNDALWEHRYNRVLLDIEKLKSAVAQREEVIEKLNAKIQILDEYKSKYSEINKIQAELNDAMKTNGDLTEELNELKTTMQDMVVRSKVIDIENENKALAEQLSEANKRISILESNKTNGDSCKDEEIQILTQALAEAQQNKDTEINESKLPLITDQVYLKAEKVFLIKEIKPAIYMLSLLDWICKYIVQKKSKTNEESLCIVFDKLDNYYKIQKYQKHNYGINTICNNIIVTNKLDIGYLNNTLKISKYKRLYIIDRLGLKTSVADRKDLLDYYLIDSPSDIHDFKLKKNKCVGFYDTQGDIAYEILPDSSIASNSNQAYGILKIFNNNFIKEALK